NQIPYLFLTCGRWEHYHQRSDTPDRLNYEKMGRIRDYLIRLAETLAGTELPATAPVDTTTFEIQLIREALSNTGAQLLAAAVGLGGLRTSADLDALASRIQSYFAI